MFGGKASLFQGVNTVTLAGQKDPFMRPKNIRRDLSPTAKPDSNIISSEDALFVLRVDKVEVLVSGNPKSRGKSWIKLTFKVLWTDCDDPECGIGKTVTHLIDTNGQYFLEDIARFVCGATNQPPEAFLPVHYEEMVGAGQPLTVNKACVQAKVHNKKTKDGKDFFQHWYSPIGVTFDANGVATITAVEDRTKPQS